MTDGSGLTCVPWDDPPVSVTDTAGDLPTERGGDPLAEVTGVQGAKPIWDNKFVPDPPSKETSNSVSGLPTIPSRFAPTPDEPPAPPSLKERSPGTIDQPARNGR